MGHGPLAIDSNFLGCPAKSKGAHRQNGLPQKQETMIHDCLFGGYDEAPPPMAPEAALRRDWSLSFHCLTYATRRGRLIIDDATGLIPSGSCCAVVGPSSVDKRMLLKPVSYTHLPSPRDLSTSRMPSSA